LGDYAACPSFFNPPSISYPFSYPQHWSKPFPSRPSTPLRPFIVSRATWGNISDILRFVRTLKPQINAYVSTACLVMLVNQNSFVSSNTPTTPGPLSFICHGLLLAVFSIAHCHITDSCYDLLSYAVNFVAKWGSKNTENPGTETMPKAQNPKNGDSA